MHEDKASHWELPQSSDGNHWDPSDGAHVSDGASCEPAAVWNSVCWPTVLAHSDGKLLGANDEECIEEAWRDLLEEEEFRDILEEFDCRDILDEGECSDILEEGEECSDILEELERSDILEEGECNDILKEGAFKDIQEAGAWRDILELDLVDNLAE